MSKEQKKSRRRATTLPPRDHQPTKAELEEDLDMAGLSV